jgi:hypothetical protein
MKWEQIDNYTKRARIPNRGWLVVYVEDVMTYLGPDAPNQTGYEYRPAMCFIPDPHKHWCLGEEESLGDGSF